MLRLVKNALKVKQPRTMASKAKIRPNKRKKANSAQSRGMLRQRHHGTGNRCGSIWEIAKSLIEDKEFLRELVGHV